MNRASATEIADRLLHDLTPVDPTAAGALGTEPDNLMPALAPADFHMHALRLGPLGLGPLREVML